jgi:hypothetical protein
VNETGFGYLDKAGGGQFLNPIEKVIGSNYSDVITNIPTAYGGADGDVISFSDVMYGQSGNDNLLPVLFSSMYGGSGQDTFNFFLYDPGTPNFEGFSLPGRAIVNDFHHGEDFILLQVQGDQPNAYLDYNDQYDLWVAHYYDPVVGHSVELGFEVPGVTQLTPGEDYAFV